MTKKKLIAEFAWNFGGQFIVILIGVLKSPVYTSLFTPEDFGRYALVESAYQFLNLFLFGWLTSFYWRFFNEYKNLNSKFNSFVTRLFCLGIVGDLIVTSLAYLYFKNSQYASLILLSGIYLPIQLSLSIIFIVFRLKTNMALYNVFRTAQVLFIFLTTLFICTNTTINTIEILIQAQIIVSLVLFIAIQISLRGYSFMSFGDRISFGWKELKKFISASIFTHLGLILITFSDRFIISIYEPEKYVGIYNQVYNLSQISVYAIVIIVNNTLAPYIHKHLTANAQKANVISEYLLLYLIVLTPITFWACIHYHELCTILLAEPFRIGKSILPWVASSSYLYGIALFFETLLMYRKKYNAIKLGFGVCILLNIAANFVLIPYLGYEVAGITTFGAYVLMLLIFVIKSDYTKAFIRTISSKKIILIILILGINYLVQLTLPSTENLQWIFIKLAANIPFAGTLFYLLWKDKTNLLSVLK